jgi:hypothetical protein
MIPQVTLIIIATKLFSIQSGLVSPSLAVAVPKALRGSASARGE